jgi:hypothetical protein
MTIQTPTLTASKCKLAFALPIAKLIQADSRDYGFDFDEEELDWELLAPLPDSISAQSFPEVDADAFEKTFQYFLS